MSNSNPMELQLNTLINEYGLMGVLDGLRALATARVEKIERSSGHFDDQMLDAFKTIASSLTVLIETLPDELDAEIALEQIIHAAPELDSDVQSLRIDNWDQVDRYR